MRKVAIFGSTGSIGTQALEIIEKNPETLSVEILSCHSNINLICEQIERYQPSIAILPDNEKARSVASNYPGTDFYFGRDALVDISLNAKYDLMLNSLIGIAGLVPTYNALISGRDVALANKETLVAGGRLIMETAENNKVNVIPVDSEHSAIFQCLQGNKDNEIKKIGLTGSGGPFRGMTKSDLEKVTKDQALKHPNWSMGAKITIDSATLMNKGLEVIEAKWLFGLKAEQIEVLIHPESIIHSTVTFKDDSTIAQLGVPDMKVPISYAFSYPERWSTQVGNADLIKLGRLTFEEPDLNVFKCLDFAFRALQEEDSYSIVLNAANEVLVEGFLKERISFLDIQEKLETILNKHKVVKVVSIDDIVGIDMETRKITEEMI